MAATRLPRPGRLAVRIVATALGRQLDLAWTHGRVCRVRAWTPATLARLQEAILVIIVTVSYFWTPDGG